MPAVRSAPAGTPRSAPRIGGRFWPQFPAESIILFSFLALIAAGTLLLQLPQSTRTGQLSWLDALFTATSAACVTGLVVVDTGQFFTPFGQLVILMLIQVGGLGIITLSSFFAILLGKKMPMRNREIVRQTHNRLDGRAFLQLIRRIVLFTLAFELAGAVGLFLCWRDDFSWPEAAYQSVFHAVSAFCNAGFSLFSTSLVGYQADLGTNLIVCALIFLGGIGFFVIYDVERAVLLRQRLSLHSRLALLTSLLLIGAGTLLFFGLEYHNVLAGHSTADRFLMSFFQSVAARTAGFNSVPMESLSNSSLMVILILMFIGGSPGSTAGGVKTTTIVLLLAMAYNRAQGRSATNILRRTVPEKSLSESFAIVLISIAILIFFNFTLQWSETGSTPHDITGSSFMKTSFEAVSAFGTVGLSTGLTPSLSAWGKAQIILLMLIGRVGPLSIAVLIGRKQVDAVQYEYYKENVMVG